MTFDEFLAAAWDEHGESSHRACNDTPAYAVARGRVHDLLSTLDEEQRQMCLAELQDLDFVS